MNETNDNFFKLINVKAKEYESSVTSLEEIEALAELVKTVAKLAIIRFKLFISIYRTFLC